MDPTDLPPPHPVAASAMPRLVFVAASEAAFLAHGLAAARAGLAAGFSVSVASPMGTGREQVEAAGLRPIPMEGWHPANPMTAGYAAGQVAAVLRELKPDLMHALGPAGILVGGTAATMAGVAARVYAPAGLGPLGARQDRLGRLARLALRGLARGPLATGRTRFLCASAAEARALGLDPSDTAVRLTDGLGPEAAAETVAALYRELVPAIVRPA